MRIGDRFEVKMEDLTVAEAVLEDIDGGIATIVIPATRIQVQVKQSLDFHAQPDGREVILDGMQDASGTGSSEAQTVANDQATVFSHVPPEGTTKPVEQSTTAYIPDDGVDLKYKELDSSVLD